MADSWEDLTDDDLKLDIVEEEPTTSTSESKPSTLPTGSDHNLAKHHPYYAAQPKFKVLQRTAQAPVVQQKPTQTAQTGEPTLEERERQYAIARAKIMEGK
mmetsp:Transcript_25313/g.28155  ORF Transcript_25313/g.28155 Transcript_25313/m.28155 type:complete len:101 (-) Transcript_25313:14-316(-)